MSKDSKGTTVTRSFSGLERPWEFWDDTSNKGSYKVLYPQPTDIPSLHPQTDKCLAGTISGGKLVEFFMVGKFINFTSAIMFILQSVYGSRVMGQWENFYVPIHDRSLSTVLQPKGKTL